MLVADIHAADIPDQPVDHNNFSVISVICVDKIAVIGAVKMADGSAQFDDILIKPHSNPHISVFVIQKLYANPFLGFFHKGRFKPVAHTVVSDDEILYIDGFLRVFDVRNQPVVFDMRVGEQFDLIIKGIGTASLA
ncbi:hypothetical protein SDC9_79580 [bioreactor metagenome]|uniref:Uncharacterized protein n=1 Tax=bioreactor metagenome TaxID=1076179 RepID=A0A644Z2Q1_9ZZZZ